MNLARIEGNIFVCSDMLGIATYDFNFDLHFVCEHPYRIEKEEPLTNLTPMQDHMEAAPAPSNPAH